MTALQRQFAPAGDQLEHVLARIHGLQKLEDPDLPNLQTMLRRQAWFDPYAGSAGYYGLTGRRGLWIAAGNRAFMMLARHPGQPEKLLLFPAAGDGWQPLLARVLDALPATAEGYQFARLPALQARLAERFAARAAPHAALTGTSEDALDWRYPVHVLDCHAVARHDGQAFKDFRKNVHRAQAQGITVETLRPDAHRAAVQTIAEDWATSSKAHGDSHALSALAEPYNRLLQLMTWLPLQGRLYRADGRPAGFAIWEETDPRRGTANALADLTTRDVKGLPEFIYADMCDQLAAAGMARVCIGGSEEDGLDRFKRKMQPAYSVPLASRHYRRTP